MINVYTKKKRVNFGVQSFGMQYSFKSDMCDTVAQKDIISLYDFDNGNLKKIIYKKLFLREVSHTLFYQLQQLISR